jgi:DNA-binding NarL/FixJ family response regulator
MICARRLPQGPWSPHRAAARVAGVTSIVIGEDDLLVREGILRILEPDGEVEVLAACADRDALLAAVERFTPDSVVTDIRMPPGFRDEGLEVARRVRREHPGMGVVVLSAHAEPAYALTLLEDGSRGRAYLLKDRLSAPGQLIGAIHEVARGGSVIDPVVVEALVADRMRAHRSALAALTPREREILADIARGLSNAAIADRLVLTKRGVEKHINAIFSKLALRPEDETVDRRVRAALLFLADGAPPAAGGGDRGVHPPPR